MFFSFCTTTPKKSRCLAAVLFVMFIGFAFQSCNSQSSAEENGAGKTPIAAEGSSRAGGTTGNGLVEAASPAVKSSDSSFLLAPGRAGVVRVGMRVGELRARFGPALREVTLQRGGEEYSAFAVGKVGQPALPALLLESLCEEGEDDATGALTDRCRIWRITVRDPRYRTVTGLRVGGRYGDLRSAAPLSFVGPNPMGIAATVEEWRMNFLLDADAIEASSLPAHRETIRDTVRITGIQLYR